MYTGGAELNLSSEISQKLYICSRTLGPTIVSEKRHNTNPALLHLYIYTSIIYFYIVPQLSLPITTTYTTKLETEFSFSYS